MLKRAGAHVRGNLVAYLALAVALGGTAYAGQGRNDVTARDLGPIIERNGQRATVPPGQDVRVTAKCKRGEVAITPEFGSTGRLSPAWVMTGTRRKPTGVEAIPFNPTSGPLVFTADVRCLKR